MPQPKSSGRQTTSASKVKGAARAQTKADPKKTKAPAGSAAGSSGSTKTTKTKAPAKTTKAKAATAKGPRTPRQPRSTQTRQSSKKATPQASDDPFVATLGAVRDRLARGLVLTGERLQETIDDAAKRGRLTHKDGEELAQRLISAGRKQTEDLLVDLEQIVERGGDELIRASRRVRKKLR